MQRVLKMKDVFLRYKNTILILLIGASIFSINLPIAFGSIFLSLFLAIWVCSGGYKYKINSIKKNPGAMVSLLLLLCYALGIIYTTAPFNEGVHYFIKYLKLLLIPMIISISIPDKYKDYLINAFLGSLIIYLCISYINWLGFLSLGIMKHGTYMAIGAYLMFRNTVNNSGKWRYIWMLLSGLTVFNILFICDVRTGVITLVCLSLLFIWETWGTKILTIGILISVLAALCIYFIPSVKQLNPRFANIIQEVTSHQPKNHPTSSGTRIEMYENTIQLIKKHPIIGGGTGSLKNEYYTLIKDSDTVLTRVTNPHNQYLSTTQDLGLVGLIVLMLFWGTHWRLSYSLSNSEYGHSLRALILATMVGSLFNSLLLDSGDGRMYCLLAGVFLSSYISKDNKIPY